MIFHLKGDNHIADVNFWNNKGAPANEGSASVSKDDLSESDLTFLFNACPARRFQSGQLIAGSSGSDDFIFLVIKRSAMRGRTLLKVEKSTIGRLYYN